MNEKLSRKASRLLLALALIGTLAAGCAGPPQKRVYRIGVLLSGDIRLEPFSGLKDGLKELGYVEGEDVVFEVQNAGGDRAKLPELAQAIVSSKPDVAVAGGGVEADALKAATEGSDLPVVFLAVASSVDRGLVASLKSSGNNFTGIDTNDTQLTAKRLEFISKMMPQARWILILHVPSITPSVESVRVAEETAPGLGLELTIVPVETEEDIRQAAASISADNLHAILLVPGTAPVRQAMKEILYPVSVAQKIPIMGIEREELERGAVAIYGPSRYATGVQAARLVDKVLRGARPADVPVETPEQLEFVINRTITDRLGLEIPDEVWGLADEVVEIEVK